MNKSLPVSLKLLLTAIVFSLSLFANAQTITPDANGIIYVKQDATGTGTGWSSPTGDLQAAINATGVTKVFVAVGNYPSPPDGFVMKNNVEIYGGFNPASGITTLAHNRILPNIEMGDGSVLDGENTRPIIRNYNNGLTNSAVLDGFTVMNSRNGDNRAIYNLNASPTLRNLVIRNNVGSGIFNNGSAPIITDVVIRDNSVAFGSGIYNSNASPVISNAVFRNNSTSVSGSVIYSTGTSSVVVIKNTQITDNQGGVGVISATYASTTLINVTMANNGTYAFRVLDNATATVGNSVVFGGIEWGSYNAQYSFMQGNTNTANGNINTTGISLTDIFTNPSAGDYTLKSTSPAINKGNNTLFPSLDANTKDLAGNLRLVGTAIDLGAYEFPYSIAPDADGIVYVKETATGNGLGTNWENATANLHNAIQATGVQKVFVAIGNYNVGDHSFIMKNGVEIYGGFDPDNNIKTLNDTRIMPNASNTNGSILNGQNTRPVIWNVFTSATAMNNTAVLDGFTITRGSYANGAGIRNVYASPTFRNLFIRANTATVLGAGIYNENSSPVITNTVISSNTITNTSIGANIYGAGVYNSASSAPVFTNITITENSLLAPVGTLKGAAIYNNNSSPKIYNSIIWDNPKNGVSTISGADIENEGTTTLILKNSITQTYNTGSTADNNKVFVNPMFTNASTGNYTLLSVSPAINTGNNSYLAGGGLDLAGNPRVYNYSTGGIIDMGAYESAYNSPLAPDANAIIYVRETTIGTGSGSSWESATADLRNAINTAGVQKVFVAVGEYKVGSASFVMKNNVEIYGGFDPDNNIKTLDDERILPNKVVSEGSVLSGENMRPVIWNVFTSETALNNTAVLDGFTVSAGKITGDGGGFRNEYASPTLTNLVIKNNYASGNGGGMYNYYSSPNITKSTFIENSAGNNGGAMTNAYSYPNLTNVIIKKNHAGFLGGGLTSGFDSSPVLTNVLIVQNTAVTNGGGIYNGSGKGVLNNVTIADNVPNAISIRVNQINNSIIFGKIEGGATRNSLIEGSGDTSNGNVYAIGISPSAIFTNYMTGNYTVRSVSPTINAGDNSLYPALDPDTKDLAGNARIINSTIDMGAFESSLAPTGFGPDAEGIIYVAATPMGNESGDSWANATNSLNRAIHAIGVSKVFVSKGSHKIDRSGLTMKNNIPIYGGFDPENGILNLSHNRIIPNLTGVEGSLLDGQHLGPVIKNIFTSSTALNQTAILDGFTITNGLNDYDGGAIFNTYASPRLTNLVIKGNNASYGGGIFNRSYSSPILTNVVLNGNIAVNDGGAMYNDVSSSPVLTNVSITGNSAKNGAGMYNRTNSSPLITNALIANNTATTNGAAIRNEASSSPSLINVAIANNSGANTIYATNGSTALANTIFYGSIAGSYTAQYSLIQGASATTNGNIDATGIVIDDVFANSTAGDYTLKLGSPAINKGNNALFTGLDGNTKDLAGDTRVHNYSTGGIIDLGAYESSFNSPLAPDANNIIYVKETATGTGSGNHWDNATADLQGAINTTDVQKVFVAIGNYNAPVNSFVLKNNVAIYGGFDPANNIKTLDDNRIVPSLTVNGSVLNGENGRRVIYNNFTSSTALTNTAVLDGFTITGGNTSFGAGMYNIYASPTLANLVIKGNTATVSGGGIATEYASPTLTNIIISGNTITATGAGRGGGMYNYSSDITLKNVIIVNNMVSTTSLNAFGGGIYSVNNAPKLTNVSITNNMVISSSASGIGGAMFNNSTNPVLTNVTIAGNKASTAGGGIYNQSTTITIYNCILWGNQKNASTVTAGADMEGGTVTLKNSITQGYTTGNSADKNKVNINPLFVSTTDFSLQAASPAINNGDNTLYTDINANTKDLAGNTRVYKYAESGVIDMGAYEYQGDPTVLPVTLVDFTAKADGNRAKLQWQTALETSNKGFEIWRSEGVKVEGGKVEGLTFVKIGDVQAKSSVLQFSGFYTFTDYSPLNGNNYYKLVQIDNNGKTTDLGIRTLNFGLQTSDIQLFPNPTADLLNISFEVGKFSQLEVIDLTGKILQRIAINVTENSKQVSLGSYPAGTYLIKLNGKGQIESKKIIKK